MSSKKKAASSRKISSKNRVSKRSSTNEPAKQKARSTIPQRTPKVRATFHLPADLVNECRNAVVWLAGPQERLTMARLAENALRSELDRLRKKHTKGKPFPSRTEELRGGRPIGS